MSGVEAKRKWIEMDPFLGDEKIGSSRVVVFMAGLHAWHDEAGAQELLPCMRSCPVARVLRR